MRIFTLSLIFLVFLTRCNTTGEDAKNILPVSGKAKRAGSERITIRSEDPSGIIISQGRSTSFPKKDPVPQVLNDPQGRSDSARAAAINYLRTSGRIPDLNEPLTRQSILNPTGNGAFGSMIELSPESFLKINFDNDILNNTDMYYTNGMRLDFIFPFVQAFPVSRLLVPYWKSGTSYYGFSVFQNMYTPSTTKTGGIHNGDRPYAAYLCAGLFKITNDAKRSIRLSSELDLGVIGSYSFGEFVQKAYHNNTPTNNEPLGWEYQIENDLVLNYNVSIEKGIVRNKYFEFNVLGSGALGTLYTNIEGGIQLRTGLMNPYFANLGVSKKEMNTVLGLKKTQVYFILKSSARMVGYDATLEGGVFNHSSPYTISPSEISRVMSETSAGITFAL